MKKPILIIFMVMAYMFVSNDDHDIQVQENEYWCDQVANGVWGASQGDIDRRCGE